MGALGSPTNIVFKNKYRWLAFVVDSTGTITVSPHVVKLSSRPSLSIEETFLNSSTSFIPGKFISGKSAWEEVTLTYFDINTEDSTELFGYLAQVYDYSDALEISKTTLTVPSVLKSDFVLELFNGYGVSTERWILKDAWPTSINFGELDYSSSEVATIELKLRYSEVKYETKESGYS